MYASCTYSMKVFFLLLQVLISANSCLANKWHHFMLWPTHISFHLGARSKSHKKEQELDDAGCIQTACSCCLRCSSFSLDFFSLAALAWELTLDATTSMWGWATGADNLSAAQGCFSFLEKSLSWHCPDTLLASQSSPGHKEHQKKSRISEKLSLLKLRHSDSLYLPVMFLTPE